MTEQIQVVFKPEADKSYPIYIGADCWNVPQMVEGFKQVAIVTNETLVTHGYLDKLKSQVSDGVDLVEIVLPDGEAYKRFDQVEVIWTKLLEHQFKRNSLMIALGGGVIGDTTGFAASCYQRGIDFVQVPTTLLSQVDSSVGGKTAVNHPLGKNMIGAFYQPKSVWIDIDSLKTLPNRELSAGLAEIIKYGLIWDEAFFEWLEQNMASLMAQDPEALTYAIRRSCEIKAEVVMQDEKESGIRAILNLGHTYGHAIEAHLGYGNWLHGEAVSVGMVIALKLSVAMGWLEQEWLDRAIELLQAAKLPIDSPSGMSFEDYLSYMQNDKKNLDKHIRLVLLKGMANAVVTSDYDQATFVKTLKEFCKA